jgi:DNA-binding MltR family transcriptional regulator
VKGLYEGVIAADLIAKQHLEQRNRIALIVLDSTLEIAFKEYLVNDSGVHYTDSQLLSLFKTRHAVHMEIKKYVSLNMTTWKKISHFSDMRNKLIHQRASAGISDDELENFREVVEGVLKKLHKLRFNVDE